jgi:hypothetical protein
MAPQLPTQPSPPPSPASFPPLFPFLTTPALSVLCAPEVWLQPVEWSPALGTEDAASRWQVISPPQHTGGHQGLCQEIRHKLSEAFSRPDVVGGPDVVGVSRTVVWCGAVSRTPGMV